MAKQEYAGQVAVRFDDDLWAAVNADAKENGRTVTQTVRHRLAQSPAIAERLEQATPSSV